MDAGDEAGVEGMGLCLFVESGRPLSSNSPDYWPTAVSVAGGARDSTASHIRALLAELDLEFPVPATPC